MGITHNAWAGGGLFYLFTIHYMARSKEAGYGRLAAQSLTRKTAGKTFYVTSAIGTGANAQFLQDVFTPDNDGVVRVYSTITLAIAALVS